MLMEQKKTLHWEDGWEPMGFPTTRSADRLGSWLLQKSEGAITWPKEVMGWRFANR